MASAIISSEPTAIPGLPISTKKSDSGAIIGGLAAAFIVCVVAAAGFVVRRRRQKRRGGLPKKGGSFADYSHAKISRGSLDRNEQVLSPDRYTYISSPFTDDAQEQVQMHAVSPGMSPPSHRYSDAPVSIHAPSISSYSAQPITTSQYELAKEQPVQPHRLSPLPPPIPPPQTRPEVQTIVLTSEGQELPPEVWFDDESRTTSRAHRDDRGYDDDQSSILSVPQSAGAPSAIELIPFEDNIAESEGFLTRSNTVASTAAGGKTTGTGSKNRLQPPQEKDEEGTRRDSSESLDYLVVA